MKASRSPYAVIPVLAAALWLCPPAAAAESPDRIELDAGQIKNLGIRVDKAEEARDYLIATLPAVVTPPPNARVAVAATFPGTVLQTLVVEGDKVTRGQSLAVIASREILSEGADLAQARARLAVAASNAERIVRLGDEGIVAGARVDEAKAQLDQTRAEVAAKARILEAVNADGSKGTYTLTAPIDGVIASAKLQAGAPVESMAAPYVVDAADSYEVQAQVPERLVGQIKPGMRVRIGADVEAKVTSVGTVIQPETRSASLKAAIAPGARVIAGKTAMAAVYAPAPRGAAVVPKGAVTDLGGGKVVFVQSAEGFVIRKVTTAGAAGEQVVILKGLAPGEPVVVAGLSDLKSIALSR